MRHTSSRAGRRTNLVFGALLGALAGCNIDYKVIEASEGTGAAGSGDPGMGGITGVAGLGGGGAGDTGGWGAAGSGGWGVGGSGVAGSTAPAPGACTRGGLCVTVAVTNIDKVDMLFVVADTASMLEEQQALASQLPRLIEVLTTGDRDGDGEPDFPPAKDLHLGVVSSDLGLVGVRGIDHCDNLGDDAVMNDQPSPLLSSCAASYPRFLSHRVGVNDPAVTSHDLACVAVLGEGGCGFGQPLETALKALWPSDDARVTFLPDPQGFGAMGQGDATMGGVPGMNAGFLRNDPTQGLSLISIVLLTDQEDCSSFNTSHFRPPANLDPNIAADAQLLQQGLNVRCNFNPHNLYAMQRYVSAFRVLREGAEDLMQFAAIVGVPPEAVAEVPEGLASDPAARDAFYAGIRNHPLMTPMVDTRGTPSPDDDAMRPSCDTSAGKAYPPNRIVDVAEGLGGLVQSICNVDAATGLPDFGFALNRIVDRIGGRLGAQCLPEELARDAAGLVSCDVIWELPLPNRAPTGTPVDCAGAPFLLPVERGESTSPEGGVRCRVGQLAVQGEGDVRTPTAVRLGGAWVSEGWYYDDFSVDVLRECASMPEARVAFTAAAKPPVGVRVILDCDPDPVGAP